MNLNFAASKDAGIALEDQQYTIKPSVNAYKKFIVIDLGNTFTGLTAGEAAAISTADNDHGTVEWYSTNDNSSTIVSTHNKLFNLGSSALEGMLNINFGTNYDVLYYADKEEALAHGLEFDKDVAIKFTQSSGASTNVDLNASTIRKIRYAVIPFDAISKNALPDTKVPFTIVLKDKDNNEIKRASAHLTVNMPSFDDILKANTEQNLWNENTFTTRVIATGKGKGDIQLVKPFVSNGDGTDLYIDLNEADNCLKYELKYTDFDKENQYVDVVNAEKEALTGTIVKDNKLIKDIEATATLYPFTDSYTNFKVTKEFNISLKSVFADVSLSYYVKGALQTGPITLEDGQYIYSGKLDANSKPDSGLFMNFDGETRLFAFGGFSNFNNNYSVLSSTTNIHDTKEECDFEVPDNPKEAKPAIYLGDGATGVGLTYDNTNTRGKLKLTNVAGGTSGTVLFTFVDMMGVHFTVPVAYKK